MLPDGLLFEILILPDSIFIPSSMSSICILSTIIFLTAFNRNSYLIIAFAFNDIRFLQLYDCSIPDEW